MLLRQLLPTALLLSCAAFAGPAPPPVRTEIDGLLASLAASGCEFNRNGSWHNASQAKSHLLRKLQYLEDRNAVRSTEDFIRLAASASSTSGKPYQVKCPGSPAVDSASWMRSRLNLARAPARQ